MSAEKSEFTASLTHKYGSKVDDFLEEAEKRVLLSAGKVQAHKEAILMLRGLLKHVDNDLDEGKFEKDEGSFGALEISSVIKRYIDRSCGIVDNLRLKAEAETVRTQGEVRAFKKVVGVLKAEHDSALAKAKKIREDSTADKIAVDRAKEKGTEVSVAEDLSADGDKILYIDTSSSKMMEMEDPTRRAPESPSTGRRSVGTHPGRGLAAIRKANSKARKIADVIEEDISPE